MELYSRYLYNSSEPKQKCKGKQNWILEPFYRVKLATMEMDLHLYRLSLEFFGTIRILNRIKLLPELSLIGSKESTC